MSDMGFINSDPIPAELLGRHGLDFASRRGGPDDIALGVVKFYRCLIASHIKASTGLAILAQQREILCGKSGGTG